MLRIGPGRLALVDAEEVRVEPGDVVDERAPLGDGTAWHTGFRVVVLLGVPSIQRHLRNGVVAPQQRLPESCRGIDASRQAARHADHGDWGDRCVCHVIQPLPRTYFGAPTGLKVREM